MMKVLDGCDSGSADSTHQADAQPASEPSEAAANQGTSWVFEFDLAGLLAGLGLSDAGGDEEDQEAAFAAEQEALDAATAVPVDLAGPIAESMPPGPGLAAWLSNISLQNSSDRDLPGIVAAYRRVASWAQAAELAAVATIASRSAARDQRIGVDSAGKPAQVTPEAAAQVALALVMSQPGALSWMSLAVRLRWQLSATGAALCAGTMDLTRARLIAEATSMLPDDVARAVEGRVLPMAAEQTWGQLRASLRRAVIAEDPEGAERRRQEAERRAQVSLYPDEEGTATLTGSCLPGVHAAAAMARISAMARALKASGAEGGLDLLRAHIYIGLLLGTMPLIPPPVDGPPDDPPSGDPACGDPACGDPTSADPACGQRLSGDPACGQPLSADPACGQRLSADPACGAPAPGGSADQPSAGSHALSRDQASPWSDIPGPGDEDAPEPDGDEPPDLAASMRGWGSAGDDDELVAPFPPRAWPTLPAWLPAAESGRSDRSTPARPPPGLLDLLIPWSALTGTSSEPALLGCIGPVTGLQAKEVAELAAQSLATQWRVILTDDNGRALAVERVPLERRQSGCGSRAGPGTTGVVGRVTITIRASWLEQRTADARPGAMAANGVEGNFTQTVGASERLLGDRRAAVLRAADRAAARMRAERAADARATGGCAHGAASLAYRPPQRIREFVAARDVTCRFLTCGQPAWRADLDHTVPWDKGGITCRCNLGGGCRTHHRIKQLPGWKLEQPQPGEFVWTTSAGRQYRVYPDRYPV
jgi:Domain of unknown function (DUF222)